MAPWSQHKHVHFKKRNTMQKEWKVNFSMHHTYVLLVISPFVLKGRYCFFLLPAHSSLLVLYQSRFHLSVILFYTLSFDPQARNTSSLFDFKFYKELTWHHMFLFPPLVMYFSLKFTASQSPKVPFWDRCTLAVETNWVLYRVLVLDNQFRRKGHHRASLGSAYTKSKRFLHGRISWAKRS